MSLLHILILSIKLRAIAYALALALLLMWLASCAPLAFAPIGGALTTRADVLRVYGTPAADTTSADGAWSVLYFRADDGS